ncbi:MAG: hypothetical protein AB7I50_09200 [Vicinamibacterales bacterium]
MAACVAPTTYGWGENARTYFKFNRSVALPNVTLPPGEYAFEISGPAFHNKLIARVSRRQSTRILFTGTVSRASRAPGGARPEVIFLDDRRDEVPQIIEWYPTSGPDGYRFFYD